jgi:hypothetical protein
MNWKLCIACGLLAVPSSALAQGSIRADSADPTVTIACFGHELALTHKSVDRGSVQVSAEVLNLGDGRRAPTGRVVFLIDDVRVGPSDGVPLRAGRDPRTGQPAGIASVALSIAGDLHLSNGSHTVVAQYVPAEGFAPSRSAAANNLEIRDKARLADLSPAAPSRNPGRSNAGQIPASQAAMPGYAADLPVKAPFVPVDTKRFYFDAEARIWSFSKSPTPPFLAGGTTTAVGPSFTGPTFVSTAPGFIGLLTATGTLTNIFDQQFPTDPNTPDIRAGQYYRLGYWLDPEHSRAVEAEGFAFFSKSSSFATATNGLIGVRNPAGPTPFLVLSQPNTQIANRTFINTTPDVFVGLFTDLVGDGAGGGATIATSSRLFGADVNYRMRLADRGDGGRIELTGGVKWVGLYESMTLGTATQHFQSVTRTFEPALGLPIVPTPPLNAPVGLPFTNTSLTAMQTFDQFETRNNFLGAQIGATGEYRWGPWWVSADAKVALGVTNERINATGGTTTFTTTSTTPVTGFPLAGIPLVGQTGAPPVVANATTATPAGLYTATGSLTRNALAVAPSGVFRIGYDIIPDTVSLDAGYSFLYLSNVARPGDQFSAGPIQTTGFLAHGFNGGVKYKF